MRVLQSHIRTSNVVSSTKPPGIDRRRAGLDFATFVAVALAPADSPVSFRGDGEHHNLVGKWNVFREEGALFDAGSC
jgi:hypothetical protein